MGFVLDLALYQPLKCFSGFVVPAKDSTNRITAHYVNENTSKKGRNGKKRKGYMII